MIDDIEDEVFALMVGFKRESPFPENKFNSEMAELGYAVDEETELAATEMPEENEMRKDVYRKGSLGVTYIQDPGVIAINIDIQEMASVKSSIEELIRMLSEKLKVDVEEDITRFQTSFKGHIWEGEPTTRYFSEQYKPDFSNIFDGDCESFSFRLVSGFDSDDLPQYDIRIEPYARNTDYFYIDMTISRDSLEDALSIVTSIGEKLEQLIGAIKDE